MRTEVLFFRSCVDQLLSAMPCRHGLAKTLMLQPLSNARVSRLLVVNTRFFRPKKQQKSTARWNPTAVFFFCANHCSRCPLRIQLCHIGNYTRPVTIHGCCLLTKLSKPCPYTSLGKRAKTLKMFSHSYMHDTCAEKGRTGHANLAIMAEYQKNIQKSYFYLFLLISTYILAYTISS